MTIVLCLSAMLASASAAEPAAPIASSSVALLKQQFTEAVEQPQKEKILKRLAATAPSTTQDITALFDLFSRFPEKSARQSVMECLGRLEPNKPQLEPLFITYLKQPDAEAKLFGINGAFHLRLRAALPLIRGIAEGKFAATKATDATTAAERDAWWVQFEALTALAQWEGEKVLPLLERKSVESPTVGRLLGRFFWRQTAPRLKSWSESLDPNARERAVQAATAPIEPADARATREEMLRVMRSPNADPEVRHQLALKVGTSSTDEEAEALTREHDSVKNDSDRLYWAAAVFSSRSPLAVPLLLRYARDAGEESMRAGAAAQLADMFGPERAAALIKGDIIDKK